ncbi:VOC family protein, partial [Streptomyces sp. NPDC058534]|uniref:VOC family protein n=1 Tax=Streptomyces sp. NPDC058534 TaxID=3346541 RepID=UPI0036541A40
MNSIDSITLEVADTEAAARFYSDAFGLDSTRVRVRASEAPTTGFRGFTLSLVVAQPGNVDALLTAAVDAGATVIKPAAKSLWGYGGVVQAPDGTIWQLATSKKKDTG